MSKELRWRQSTRSTMFNTVVNAVDRLEVALSDCQGPYRTTKTAIMAIFQNCFHCQCHSLYIADIYHAMWKIEEKIKRTTPLCQDEIDSALRSLSYERKLKARGDGHYIIHPFHLPAVSLTSGYNQTKEKITAREKKEKQGFVYYVQWENDPLYVKIGYSSKPSQRFVDFLTSNPHKLIVLRLQAVPNKDEEQVLHHEFKGFRQNREWFAYVGRLREYIEKLTCETARAIEKDLSPCHKEQIIIRSF